MLKRDTKTHQLIKEELMVNCLNMFFFCNKSAAPVVDGLDPNGLIMYRLYRDATLYTDGTHVKVRIPVDRD